MSSIFIRYGEILTTNKFNQSFLHPSHFRDIEWFRPPNLALPEGSYGPFKGFYKINRTLNLLNLGDPFTRQMLFIHTDLSPIELNPDVQYSGHQTNLRVHQAILRSPFFQRFDGTILTTSLIHPSIRDFLEGPEEVVLFTQRIYMAISLEDINIV